jgi:tRNA G18 (ribose-2'-O)-methylase SpoU
MSRGHFGIGIFHTKTFQNIGTLWRSAHCFGAAYIFTIGHRYPPKQSSDTMKTERHIPLYNYADMDDLVSHLPFGTRIVGIELLPESRALGAYAHPAQACYLLGAEDNGLSDDAVSRCHDLIQIEGSSRCLNVAVAGSIVMHHRILGGRHV